METFSSSNERLATGEEFVEGEGDVGEFEGLDGGGFDGEGDLKRGETGSASVVLRGER